MKLDTALRLAERQLGSLEAQHRDARSLDEFIHYAEDPVSFIRDVLGGEPCAVQEGIARAILRNRSVAVQSSNGFGKDWLAARLALWWVYARRGLALVLGPTERQVREVVMRHEVRPAFHGVPGLPGSLYELALRVDGAGGILSMTSTDASRLTGFHHPRGVLIVLTEAQGIEGHTWEAALANTTGEDCRILAVGNPLSPVGRFFEVCRSERWKTFKLSAFDHPNVIEGREVIPGAVTQAFVDSVREEYGEDSPIYVSRVLGQFPTDAEEVLVRREWLEASVERWEKLRAESLKMPCRVALDPARFGSDESVLALAQGPVLLGFRAWRAKSLMETTGRLQEAITELEAEEGGVKAFHVREVTVDEIGLGGGVVDRLHEQGLRVEGFNGARSPSEAGGGRFVNRRAEAFWHLRSLLERSKIALPRDEKLFEELTAIQWTVNSAGRIQIGSKDITRRTLGRSPDRADACSMVFASLGARRRRFGVYYPGMKREEVAA